ncbi:MAG: lipoate--protein ligase family protein [Anaerolineae bacterium]|nr:lipoate--protein ligase family protein [Anaerolineae bacterium]
MEKVRLLDLGSVSPLRSQTMYHAAGYALTENSPNTIILINSNSPYVCIGFHQDLDKEVDVEYCREHDLSIYRREVGGGAVFLDDNQVFTQWIFQPGVLPASLDERFELYIKSLVDTYQAYGVNAYHRPVNDIHVDGKKIGGTGAAQIGRAEVVVGSLMFDFNKATMARVLKASSEKMRDKIFESLEQYMTTMRELLDEEPDRQKVKETYMEMVSKSLGVEVVPGSWTDEEEEICAELDARFASDEWVNQVGGLRKSGVKIHEDVRVVEAAFKAPGGLIRVTARLNKNIIDDLAISGDFTLFPSKSVASLEESVRGLAASGEVLTEGFQKVYQALNLQSPGVTANDFSSAVLAAATAAQP